MKHNAPLDLYARPIRPGRRETLKALLEEIDQHRPEHVIMRTVGVIDLLPEHVYLVIHDQEYREGQA